MTKYYIEKGHKVKYGRVAEHSQEFTDLNTAWSTYNTTSVNRRKNEYVTLYSLTGSVQILIIANKGKGVTI